jgi:hypothetical protein
MKVTGMVRAAETVIRTIGGCAVRLRLRTTAGTVAGEVIVEPVLVRREKKNSDGKRAVELLMPVAAVQRAAESCGAATTRALVESVLGASVGSSFYRKTTFSVEYVFGDEYMWRVSAVE